MITKKGISPVIATILLIVIALILVGILLSWGQNFIQRNTSDADNAINRKCIGADIQISNCDYNSTAETLTFIIVNSGKVDFPADGNINAILIDEDSNLANENTNIIDGNAFNRGDSFRIVIDDYVANPPIDVEIRSTQCVTYFSRVSCD